MNRKSYILFFAVSLFAWVLSAAPVARGSLKLFDANGDGIFENLAERMKASAPGERIPVIVQYRETVAPLGAAALMSGILKKGDLKFSYVNIPAIAASMTRDQIQQALRDPQVDHVELDAQMHECMDTAAPSFGVTAARAQFGFTGNADGNLQSFSNHDIVIAIIDTGVAGTHPDFRGKILYFKDYVNGRTLSYDDEGHGTHVAGTAAGSGRVNEALAGVAPGAGLVVFKVLDSTGSGSISNGIAAIDEAISRKTQFNIRVLNLSFAVSGSSQGNDVLSLACNRATAAGIVTVVAAGNDGPNARTIGSPSAAANVITVGAGADLGENGFYLAKFSSRGPTADGRIKPDLWAPGVRIKSPRKEGGYNELSGTSLAAPFVSGVVALMLNAKPTLTPGAVKGILNSTAMRWATGGKNNEAGFGRLQAYQAIARAASIHTDLHPPEIPRLRFTASNIQSNQEHSYRIHVASTRFPVAVSVIIFNNPSSDINLQVLDPSGILAGKATTIDRQETVAFQPSRSGDYTIKISNINAPTDYWVDVSGDISQ